MKRGTRRVSYGILTGFAGQAKPILPVTLNTAGLETEGGQSHYHVSGGVGNASAPSDFVGVAGLRGLYQQVLRRQQLLAGQLTKGGAATRVTAMCVYVCEWGAR